MPSERTRLGPAAGPQRGVVLAPAPRIVLGVLVWTGLYWSNARVWDAIVFDLAGLDRDGLVARSVDFFLIVGEPTFPGCTVGVRVLGVLDMEDDKGQDEKLLTVASGDPRWDALRSLDDVPEHLRIEISHFFATYKQLEHLHVAVRGWRDREAALEVLAASRERWAASDPPARSTWPN